MKEAKFYEMIRKMYNEGRITKEEHDAMEQFVCGLYDYLSVEGIDIDAINDDM